jgi:hypothetical protein
MPHRLLTMMPTSQPITPVSYAPFPRPRADVGVWAGFATTAPHTAPTRPMQLITSDELLQRDLVADGSAVGGSSPR